MSNFCPDTRGRRWLLIRLTCSVVPWGRRNTASKYHWHVWGELSVSWPQDLPPVHGVCAFPVYTAQAPGCSAGELSKVGPGSSALPRSKPLRFRFSGTPHRHKLSWACVLCPSQVQASQVTRGLASVLSSGCGVSYHLPGPNPLVYWVHSRRSVSGVSCVSSEELISDCNLPDRCQPS